MYIQCCESRRTIVAHCTSEGPPGLHELLGILRGETEYSNLMDQLVGLSFSQTSFPASCLVEVKVCTCQWWYHHSRLGSYETGFWSDHHLAQLSIAERHSGVTCAHSDPSCLGMHTVYIAKLCAYLSSSFPALASTLGTRLPITVAGPAL